MTDYTDRLKNKFAQVVIFYSAEQHAWRGRQYQEADAGVVLFRYDSKPVLFTGMMRKEHQWGDVSEVDNYRENDLFGRHTDGALTMTSSLKPPYDDAIVLMRTTENDGYEVLVTLDGDVTDAGKGYWWKHGIGREADDIRAMAATPEKT